MKMLFATVLLCAPMLAQASDVAAPAAEKEKKVCRAEETTGSLFAKRVCHTKAEWASLDAERQRATDSFHDQSRIRGADTAR